MTMEPMRVQHWTPAFEHFRPWLGVSQKLPCLPPQEGNQPKRTLSHLESALECQDQTSNPLLAPSAPSARRTSLLRCLTCLRPGMDLGKPRPRVKLTPARYSREPLAAQPPAPGDSTYRVTQPCARRGPRCLEGPACPAPWRVLPHPLGFVNIFISHAG